MYLNIANIQHFWILAKKISFILLYLLVLCLKLLNNEAK